MIETDTLDCDDVPTARRFPRRAGINIGAARVGYLRSIGHATPAAALAAIWPCAPGTSTPARLPGVPPEAPTPCPPPAADAAHGAQLWLSAATLPAGMLPLLREWGAIEPHGIAGIVRAVVTDDAHAARGERVTPAKPSPPPASASGPPMSATGGRGR
jgi:hypothetical protein